MDISIVTTAALPWLTGMSINALLRAAYLSKDFQVELIIPECTNAVETCESTKLLKRNETIKLSYEYLKGSVADTSWCQNNLKIRSYEAIYRKFSNSLYPKESIIDYPFSGDILILEDPLQLMSHPNNMKPNLKLLTRKKFKCKYKLTIGIIETNWFYFIPEIADNIFQEQFGTQVLKTLGRTLLNRHLDLTIDLVPVLPKLHDRRYVKNVNGVGEQFFTAAQKSKNISGNYYIGKLTHLKKVDVLLQWSVKYKIFLDMYGQILRVPDELPSSLKKQYDARLAQNLEYLNSPYINYFNSTNSPDLDLANYKTFINLSLSEMLCTSTAEALAMGKFAILPDHPSNHFFKQFKNALFHQNEEEAIRSIRKTETLEPEEDIAIEQLHWSQANKRLWSIINDNL